MSKHVIITGTSSGIGFELAKLFADESYHVLALSRNEKPIAALKHSNITTFSFDVTQAASIEKLHQFLTKEWKQVDILINNAGKLLNKPFSKTTIADFKAIYDVNLFGVVKLTQTVLSFMDKNSHIVNISSVGGLQGSVKFSGLSAYSSSKGALITLTEMLAEEYKDTGPACNALALGAVQTEMLAKAFPDYKAPVTAKEMATYIYNFALKGHQFYNGKVLPVSKTTP